jgi:uncharacterized protein
MVSQESNPFLEILRREVLGYMNRHPAKVYFLGIPSTGWAGGYSDIYVAILPLEPLPNSLLPNLREGLEEGDVIYDVNVVDLSEADEEFRQRVEKDGVLWKE